MIYLYLDASFRRFFKQKYSSADLIHGPINKSEHSDGLAWLLKFGQRVLDFAKLPGFLLSGGRANGHGHYPVRPYSKANFQMRISIASS